MGRVVIVFGAVGLTRRLRAPDGLATLGLVFFVAAHVGRKRRGLRVGACAVAVLLWSVAILRRSVRARVRGLAARPHSRELPAGIRPTTEIPTWFASETRRSPSRSSVFPASTARTRAPTSRNTSSVAGPTAGRSKRSS